MPFSALGILQSKRVLLRVLVISIVLAALLIWRFDDLHISRRTVISKSAPVSNHPPCWNSPGGNETLVVFRTGATEVKDRFPVHTTTTLRCFPHYLIFSDVEEDYLGEHILDALDSVSPDIIANNPDFELYRRLQQGGRDVLLPEELSGSDAKVAHTSGETDNPGWKLDKWKFLPMLNRTLYEYPQMHWYVFVEADTLILWSILQGFLGEQDYTRPSYIGYMNMVGSEAFAHGGTGFILSQPALKIMVEYYAAHKAELEALIDGQWAGDIALGITFKEAGVPLTTIKPILQGNNPGVVLYGRPDGESVLHEPTSQPQIWCTPTASYHHMSTKDIEDLWRFEQRWLSENVPDVPILRHKDVFKHYVMPQMTTPKQDWDNMSDDEVGDHVGSLEECRAACEAKNNCRQYSFEEGGPCSIRVNPRLGAAKQGITSGWITDRVVSFEQNMKPCEDKGTWSTEPW